MDSKKAVVIKTFWNLAEAQLTQINLESMGINTYLKKDDVGGAYPSLQLTHGVQLLVAPEDVPEAEEILKEFNAEEVWEIENKADLPRHKIWTVFILGILFAILFSTIAYMLFHKDHRILNGNRKYDTNGDGRFDRTYVYSKGKIIEIKEDRNHDGDPDAWYYYKANKIIRSEYDNDFDGNIDQWCCYEDRYNIRCEVDTDFNGIPDATHFVTNGVTTRVDWHPNGSKVIVRRELFTHGIKTEAFIDSNKDGVFDLELTFDPYGNEIRRKKMR